MDAGRKVIAIESLGTPPNNIKEGDVYTVVVEWDDYVEVDEVMGWWSSDLFKPYVEVKRTCVTCVHQKTDLDQLPCKACEWPEYSLWERNEVSMESNNGGFFKATNDPEHPILDLTKVVDFHTIKKPVVEINPTIGSATSKDPHEGIVTKPPHYTRWAIEPIEFLFRNRVEGHIFNIVKYSMRAGHKLYPGMDAVQSEIVDLKKAARYIEMRINLLEGKEVL
jgi:hypothetical protein